MKITSFFKLQKKNLTIAPVFLKSKINSFKNKKGKGCFLSIVQFLGQGKGCILSTVQFLGQGKGCILSIVQFNGQGKGCILSTVQLNGQGMGYLLRTVSLVGKEQLGPRIRKREGLGYAEIYFFLTGRRKGDGKENVD